MIKRCTNCNCDKDHHAKGLCYACYKKLRWQPKVSICKRCKREMVLHAKGLCPGCYNFVFHLENNKAYNHRKAHGIDVETYREVTRSCVICGFDKVVDLHHLDSNKKNNSRENLVGLCPNHHRMIHNYTFRRELFELLKGKGFSLPFDEKQVFTKNK